MSRVMGILWIVVGANLVISGLTIDTLWFKWFLIFVGALSIVIQVAALIRQSKSA